MEKLYATIPWTYGMDSLLGPEYQGELMLIDRKKLYIKLICVWEDREDMAFAYVGDMPRAEISIKAFDAIRRGTVDNVEATEISLDWFDLLCYYHPALNECGLEKLLLHLVNDVT